MLPACIFRNWFLPIYVTVLIFSGGLCSAQNGNTQGEATTYFSFKSAHEISGLGYATLYNQKNFWQLRYNYEEMNTLSFFWGRPFEAQKKSFYLQVVPSIGVSLGQFNGIHPAVMLFAGNEIIEFSSSNQFSVCLTHPDKSFFYSWTDAIYTHKGIAKLGSVVQFLNQYAVKKSGEQVKSRMQVDIGLVTGFEYRKIEALIYLFLFDNSNRHFALGVTYSFP